MERWTTKWDCKNNQYWQYFAYYCDVNQDWEDIRPASLAEWAVSPKRQPPLQQWQLEQAQLKRLPGLQPRQLQHHLLHQDNIFSYSVYNCEDLPCPASLAGWGYSNAMLTRNTLLLLPTTPTPPPWTNRCKCYPWSRRQRHINQLPDCLRDQREDDRPLRERNNKKNFRNL